MFAPQLSNGKDSRLNFRVSSEQHELLKCAAELTGTNVSDFVVSRAIERAHQVVASYNVTRIHAEHAEAFQRWLDAPAEAISELKPLADAEPFS